MYSETKIQKIAKECDHYQNRRKEVEVSFPWFQKIYIISKSQRFNKVPLWKTWVDNDGRVG